MKPESPLLRVHIIRSTAAPGGLRSDVTNSAGKAGIELAYVTMGSIGNNIDAIQRGLDEVVDATKTYKTSDNDYSARYDLMVKATRLLQTIRGPVDMLFANFENVHTLPCALGTRETLTKIDGQHGCPPHPARSRRLPRYAHGRTKHLRQRHIREDWNGQGADWYISSVTPRNPQNEKKRPADETVRLMRALTPLGPFRETGEEEYAHTPFSEIYMVPQMNAIFKVLYVCYPLDLTWDRS